MSLILFLLYRNPNSGITKLPLTVNNVNTLPEWPSYTSSKEEYLDMRSLSQMVVGTKLRKKYCEFLMDPEGVTARAKTDMNTAAKKTGHLLLLGIALLYNIY